MSVKIISDHRKKEAKESEGLQITSTLSQEADEVVVKVRQHEFSIGWPGSEISPCPGEYMLGALAGCSSAVASVIAKQMSFDLRGIAYEMSGFGSSTKLAANARLTTTESDERIQELKKATERVCPVFQFFKSTGIQMEIDWQRTEEVQVDN